MPSKQASQDDTKWLVNLRWDHGGLAASGKGADLDSLLAEIDKVRTLLVGIHGAAVERKLTRTIWLNMTLGSPADINTYRSTTYR